MQLGGARRGERGEGVVGRVEKFGALQKAAAFVVATCDQHLPIR